MSENTEKLRAAIVTERYAHEAVFIAGSDAEFDDEEMCESATNAALAAVEQEMAALRLSYENASRAHFEATKRIDALTECQAKLQAGLAELANWKESALLVESTWDEQRVGRLLGVGLGEPIRANIEPSVRLLIGERDELRTLLLHVSVSGVTLDDDRMDYVVMQMDRDTWTAVCDLYAEKAAQ